MGFKIDKLIMLLVTITLLLFASLIPSISATNKQVLNGLTIANENLKNSFDEFINSNINCGINDGQTIYGTIEHDGLLREYILYIPDSYTGTEPVPLVFNFHGYTSSAESQMVYADFRPIADAEGFLVVHPQGTEDNLGNPYWNVGAFFHPGGDADDLGFTDALIDHLAFNYSINQNRIYATGMSNGGFFSFHLAGLLSNRFAAVAPVAGTMTTYTLENYDPQHPTAILQIHGTADYVVSYDGTTWSLSVDEALDYWIDFNNCNTEPIITQLPDIDPDDGSTVTHFAYEDGDNGVKVEHFRVNGGGHDWPGSNFGGNQDIDACAEIWQFFSNYSLLNFIAHANGPYIGFEKQIIQFNGEATNGVPPYQWHWDFGDGTTSNEQNPMHSYDSIGNYTVVLTVEDNEDNIVQDTTWAKISELPVLEPPEIYGPADGKVGVEYDYHFIIPSITYCDDLRLRVDWGIDGPGKWNGPYSPGENVTLTYTWRKKGDYKIRAQVKDIYAIESIWNEKDVTMPRYNVKINDQFCSFYFIFLKLFPVLRNLFL
jgi:polyhydroxybutyrate depolymerase